MKILYIAKFQPSTGTYGGHENDVVEALRDLGITIWTCQYKNASLKWIQKQYKDVDVFLFSKAKPPQINQILKWAHDQNILTVTWIWDLYWGYRPRKPEQFNADLLFTTDGGHQEYWDKFYPHHQILRQGISRKYAYVAPRTDSYDVGFVGSLQKRLHPGRQHMINFCRYQYKFIHHTKTRGEALNRALSDIKVVVGDSYPAKRYWSNRIYEMLGRGAFLLHPEIEGMDEEFEDGTHYVSFRRGDPQDLQRKIDYYLDHPDERLAIATRGFEHVSRHYTYHTRCQYLLNAMKKALSKPRAMPE